MPDLFDHRLRLLRRDRAARLGTEDFLHRRALDDMIERLSMIRRTFDRVLLLGCITPATADEVRTLFRSVDLVEPSELLAAQLGARHGSDISLDVAPGSYDLILSLGTIGEANDPFETLLRFRLALEPGGLLLGAVVGGDSLSTLRAAMREADGVFGTASPHVHPRMDPGGLVQLLTQAGLQEPVVDVDRVEVRYSTFQKLVEDLRGMAGGNMLAARDRAGLSRQSRDAARNAFSEMAADDGKTSEYFDLLHFAGWRNSEENS